MYKLLIRPILFWFDPEKVHHFTFSALKFLNKVPFSGYLIKKYYHFENPKLEREVFGIKFKA
jgi:dihydroorotate dehydrogenase